MEPIVPQAPYSAKPEVISADGNPMRPFPTESRSVYPAPVKKHLLWIVPLFLVALALSAGSILLIHWVTGGACRELIERKTAEALQVKTELAPLSCRWIGISSPRLSASGYDQSTLKTLEASTLRVSLKPSSLLKGVWGVEEIAIDKLTLHLGKAAASSGQEIAAAQITTSGSPLPKWLPSLLVIDVIRSGRADALIDLANGQSVQILDTALEVHPEGGETRLEGKGGVLKSPFLPDLNLVSARARLTTNGLDLGGADLAFPEGGTLRLEGSFPYGDTLQRLQGHWDHVPIPSLFPLLSGKVVGTLEGEGVVTWKPDSLQSLSGTIHARDVTLAHIPSLESIASFTGIQMFRNLPVQEARGTFSRNGGTTLWSDVVLESKGYLKITGGATALDNGSLDGTFQLGITSSIVNMIPAAGQILGLNEHDGYIWMPLHVGGTLSHPTEDYTQRLTLMGAAAAEGVIRNGLEALGIKGVGGATNLPSTTPLATNPASTNAGSQPGNTLPADAVKAATNAVRTIEQGAGQAIDALGGFLK
jgi:hypothetical protein